MNAATESAQERTGYSNARKRAAAQVRATGGTQEEAAQEAEIRRETVSDWERGNDPEYWWWHGQFVDKDIQRVGSEGRRTQRFEMRPFYTAMEAEERRTYCRENGITSWQFERMMADERNRLVRNAGTASRVAATSRRREVRISEDPNAPVGGGLAGLVRGMFDVEIPDADADEEEDAGDS